MKVFIIHAHPEQNSFSSALFKTAVDHLRINNDVKVSDLYAMGFDPVGGPNDFSKLRDLDYFKYQIEQINAVEHNLFNPSLKEEIKKIRWADVVIFNFPLWWFSFPAIRCIWSRETYK